MVYVTVLFLKLMDTLLILATKPFSLVKLSFIFGVRSICIVVHTWIELLRAAIWFHVNVFWRIMVWTVALISLPARILTAIQREKLLEMHLHEMQTELETLLWDRKELQDRLQSANKENRIMEVMLAELEEEHDQAILKIDLLEGEVQDLKDENCCLKEVQSKALWSAGGQVDTGDGRSTKDADKFGIPSWISCYSQGKINLEDLLTRKDALGHESKEPTEMHESLIGGSKASGRIMSTSFCVNRTLEERREVAVSRSLFSAILSLLVGIIIWEAEDPCMPLVAALFTVVGMSLMSAVQFFASINNRLAIDAVALLSFNWFILGTLTYPTLPRAAHMFAPFAQRFLRWTIRRLGFSS
ncbi:hypothetical protein RJ640_015027 [Escallonia rubra]|uniref:Uncharacterized protein n=1 Tax=Escallonia rubra TaxID=112253 RepID=A0AA88SDZ0_9ASTE|nr:hypothetical protein RJ640_015027 [Escallonia rubra]